MIDVLTGVIAMPVAPTEVLYHGKVEPQWIDYNGHMNVAYYVLAFDRATDRFFDRLGVGEAYRRATNHSLFALEAHVTYERELKEGEAFAVACRLIDADRKRLHMFHHMMRAEGGETAATMEVMGLHVDLAGPRSIPMADELFARIEAQLAADRALPTPPQLGRKIGIRR
jgi:acyl-CoA thioester hydrolase